MSTMYTDITAPITPELPAWEKECGLGETYRILQSAISEGAFANVSVLPEFMVHTGTHVDGPNHFMPGHTKGVESLSLETLNGSCIVTKTLDVDEITADVVRSLNLPKNAKRVLFKTRNTVRELMHRTSFHEDYTAITACGAAYIAKETSIDFVGIDYLSIAPYHNLVDCHQNLLGRCGREIAILEGAVLNEIDAGEYDILCMPINFVGSDGAPCRAALKPSQTTTTTACV